MASIIISSDSPSTAERMAQIIAHKTGYAIVDRMVLPEVAQRYEIQEDLLNKALDSPSGFLGMSSKNRKLALARIQAVTLEKLLPDNVVCHGLCAHLYAKGVSHFLKVRILSPQEKLIGELRPNASVPEEKIPKILSQFENKRKRWSMEFFKQDETNAGQYDLVVSLNQIEEDDAADMVVQTASHRKFVPMTYSINCVKEFLLASQVRALLIPRFPEARVRAEGQNLVVHVQSLKRNRKKYASLVKETASTVPGVKYVEVHVATDFIGQAVESQR